MLLVCRESFERMSAGTKRKREQGEEFGGEIGKILNKGQRHAMQENECYHRPERRSNEPSRGGGWSWSVRFLNPLLKSGREVAQELGGDLEGTPQKSESHAKERVLA